MEAACHWGSTIEDGTMTAEQTGPATDSGQSPSRASRQGGKRQLILAAAAEVFQAGGYARSTMDQIAAKAHVAKGSLYNYFKSKQDLFMALFMEAIAVGERQTDELIAADLPATEKIERLIDIWFTDFEHYCSIGGLVLEFWASAAREDREGKITESLQNIYRLKRDRIAAIIAQGMATGQFRQMDAPWAASAVMALLDGLMVQSILHMGVQVDAGFLVALKRGLLASLAAPASTPQRGGVSDDT